MTDKARITQHIDALEIAPVDNQLRRRAALNVCAAMQRQGDSLHEIRAVLEALGLDRLPAGHRPG